MNFRNTFDLLKQKFTLRAALGRSSQHESEFTNKMQSTSYWSAPVAGKILTVGKRPDHEARHIEARRLVDALGHIVATNAQVPGKDIIQQVPLKYFGGAYSRENTLISESCLWRLLASGMDCATKSYTTLPDPTDFVDAAVFGGTLFPHFGHLMVESTARSWWLLKNDPSLPLILQFQGETDVVPNYCHRLFELAGIRTIIVPKGAAVAVKKLIIPEPALVERKHCHPDFLLFFDKTRTSVQSAGKYPDYGTRLFVARGEGVARVHGEEVVWKELERQGYKMLNPTSASMEEQIAAFAGATHIVGSIGSAMHNIVYARKAQKVAYLVRADNVSTTFPSIDQACGQHEAHYLYVGLSPLPAHGPLKGPYLIDVELACHHLFEAGLLPHRVDLEWRDVIASRDQYMNDWAANVQRKA